jgi:hypothetical protein
VAAKNFDEYWSEGHENGSRHEHWLTWEAATNAAEQKFTSTNSQSAFASQIADKISLRLGDITIFNAAQVINDIHKLCQQLRT